ncbi:hypothetical protein BJX64DRAFT_53794 [Aspergillus heterothallicus]
MAHVPNATGRSARLLESLPFELLQMILDHALSDLLYRHVRIGQMLRCRIILFADVVRCTKDMRGVCTSWANITRSLVFMGKSPRRDCHVVLSRLMTAEETQTFPTLRDCAVTLCHPYNLHDVYALQQQLANTTHSLDYVSLVTWAMDDPMDIMLRRTQGMGYDPYASALVATFVDECLAAGLKIADTSGRRPNGGDHTDSERLRSAGLCALKQFVFKEILGLWYYNAQIVRQIFSSFPKLEYAMFPVFLHVPLLARVEHFFPQCEDDSAFAPITHSPPQILHTIGINYKDGGRSYSDIMATMKAVGLASIHYPAALGLFPERFSRQHLAFGSLLILNQWNTRQGEVDFGDDVLSMLRSQLAAALMDVPEERKPSLFSFGDLQYALND